MCEAVPDELVNWLLAPCEIDPEVLSLLREIYCDGEVSLSSQCAILQAYLTNNPKALRAAKLSNRAADMVNDHALRYKSVAALRFCRDAYLDPDRYAEDNLYVWLLMGFEEAIVYFGMIGVFPSEGYFDGPEEISAASEYCASLVEKYGE